MSNKTILEMKHINKSFPGVRALQDVDFTLCGGEIHALMGENGAGKSTLIKVLTGVYEKDDGQIFVEGNDKEVSIRSPQDAQRLGISTVYQEITLCPNLSVAENMYIGRTENIYQDWKKMNADADKLRAELKSEGTFLLNLMSSPGAGKTTTLKRTISMLKDTGRW